MYTAKNHTEGPDKLVIGGELVVEGDLKFGEEALSPRFISRTQPLPR
jgi:hypothetical protein